MYLCLPRHRAFFLQTVPYIEPMKHVVRKPIVIGSLTVTQQMVSGLFTIIVFIFYRFIMMFSFLQLYVKESGSICI